MNRRYHIPSQIRWSSETDAEESARLQGMIMAAIRRAIESSAKESSQIVTADFEAGENLREPFSATQHHPDRDTYSVPSYQEGGPPTEELPIIKKQRSSREQVEVEWTREHPEGRVTQVGANTWILWNFDIGSSRLKPEHATALVEIYDRWLDVKQSDSKAFLYVTGHASQTGSEQTNRRISELRLEALNEYFAKTERQEIPRVIGGYFGESRPWKRFALFSGEAMAQNRRIEINVRFTPRRTPKEPEAEEAPPEEVPGEVSEGILMPVGLGFKWTYKAPGVPIPIRDMFILYPEGVFEFSGNVAGSEARGYVEIQKDNVAVKAKLNEIFDLNRDFKLSLEKDKVQLTSKFFNKSVELGVAYEFTKGPVLVGSFDPMPCELKIPLSGGLNVELKGTFNLEVKLGASPALLARVATRAAQAGRAVVTGVTHLGKWAVTAPTGIAATSIAGGVAGTTLLLLGASYFASSAREEGRRQALMGYTIAGFSLRIAGEVIRSIESYNRTVDKLEELRKTGQQESRAAYNGWVAGELMLMSVPDEKRAAVYARIKKKYGDDVNRISENIDRKLGPKTNWASDALPKTLEEFLSL